MQVAKMLPAVVVMILLASLTIAEVPQVINYQGYLTNTNNEPLGGDYQITFTIWNDPSASDPGNNLWSSGEQTVTVEEGFIVYDLGSAVPLPHNIADDTLCWLGVKIGEDDELLPRTRLGSVLFAYHTLRADSVGTVDGASGGTISSSLTIQNDLEVNSDLYVDHYVGIGTASPTERLEVVGNVLLKGKATIGNNHNNNGNNSFIAGYVNTAEGNQSTVSGGYQNRATGDQSSVGGGQNNNASAEVAVIGGGQENVVHGAYSAILGGYADTITGTADYSYLFGIGSKLTQDSTFMVKMPHIRFGDETDGYEFPVADGTTDQIMTTDGSGQLSWVDPPDGSDADWTLTDDVLYTFDEWGIARAGNILYGGVAYTHVNLGAACTTGIDGVGYGFATVGGGAGNTAGRGYSTVSGGQKNTASGSCAFIGGGQRNKARGLFSVVAGGGGNSDADSNAAVGNYSAVGGGSSNTAVGNYSAVGGGSGNDAKGEYSAIVGGIDNTIGFTGDYSYLFGIGSNLTQDSTFMVDMPHIRFGDETDGYEFPVADGSTDQVLQTDGNGQVNWATVAGGGGWADDGDIIRLETSTDSVGIGTTSPSEKLDVEGNIHAGGTITGENGSGYVGHIGGDDAGVKGLSTTGWAGLFRSRVGVLNPSGDSLCVFDSTAGGGGAITNWGPLGSRNVRMSSLASNYDYGYITVFDDANQGRAGMYVHESGNGSIYTKGPNGYDNVTISANAVDSNFGFISIMDSTGTTQVRLFSCPYTGEGFVKSDILVIEDELIRGDLAVQLPDSAVNHDEILDEPGIAQGFVHYNTINISGQSSMTDVVTVTIDIPAPGYVVVEVSAQAGFSGTTSSNYMGCQIDSTAGGSKDNNYYYYVGFASTPNTQNIWLPVSMRRTYYETAAASYTYRFEAYDASLNGSKYMWNPVITATYYPTSYGTVTTKVSSSESELFESMEPTAATGFNGIQEKSDSETRYMVDLRELELKAAKAKASALQAERDLLRAKEQLRGETANNR